MRSSVVPAVAVLAACAMPACAHRATVSIERQPMIDVRDQPNGGHIAFDEVVNAVPSSAAGATASAMTGAFVSGFRDAASRHDDIDLVDPDDAGTLVEVTLVAWDATRDESVDEGEPCAVEIDGQDATVTTRAITSVTSGLVVVEVDVTTAAGGVLIDDEITRAFRLESEGVLSSFEDCAEPLYVDPPQATADDAGVDIAREIVAALVPVVHHEQVRFDRCRGLDACDAVWRLARSGQFDEGLQLADEALADDALSDRQRAGLLYNRALLARSAGAFADAEANVTDALALHDGGRRWRALRRDVRAQRAIVDGPHGGSADVEAGELETSDVDAGDGD